MFEYKPMFKGFLFRVVFLDYGMDKIKWGLSPSHQTVSTVDQIPFKSIENFRRLLVQKFLLSCTPVALNQGQGQLD